MKFFVENSTLCEVIVTPHRLEMWYAYSRRENVERHRVKDSHAARAADVLCRVCKNY